jgi:hypothetical protein
MRIGLGELPVVDAEYPMEFYSEVELGLWKKTAKAAMPGGAVRSRFSRAADPLQPVVVFLP